MGCKDCLGKKRAKRRFESAKAAAQARDRERKGLVKPPWWKRWLA